VALPADELSTAAFHTACSCTARCSSASGATAVQFTWRAQAADFCAPISNLFLFAY